jgi:hypothetical protein
MALVRGLIHHVNPVMVQVSRVSERKSISQFPLGLKMVRELESPVVEMRELVVVLMEI